MDDALISKIKNDMYYEFARSAPPEGFPAIVHLSSARWVQAHAPSHTCSSHTLSSP